MSKLLFQGHGSFRITTNKGIVIYVDPFAGEGYDIPADIVLITHQHGDHNQIQLINKKPDCIVIQNYEALINHTYMTFTVNDVQIEAVPAYNINHDKDKCVGYIISFDDIKLYAAGDTSTTKEMEQLAALNLDYALLPIDGIYNMDPTEATICADIIKAKHTIPIHMKPKTLFDETMANQFNAKNRLIVKAGEEITL